MEPHRKDPERVRLGRLGALSVHARGRTNTVPARAAWEATLAAEVDPDGLLSPTELDRRVEYALRVRMTRLAMARWGKKKASRAVDMPQDAKEDTDAPGTHQPQR